MRLLRFGPPGAEKPALLAYDQTVRDLSVLIDDIEPETLTDRVLDQIRDADLEALPIVQGRPRIGPCIGRVGKFIGIGLNYSDHAAELGEPVPPEPVLFLKATSSICGPADDIVLPRGANETDWGVELGVVIGRRAAYVAEEEALDHVAGYCVVNDITERAFQYKHCGQWTKGKSADTFGPIGPYLVTRDEIEDPQMLRLWLEVDHHRYQDGTTMTMVYDVKSLISYISRFMTLLPGDLIATGTPPGVGLAQDPPVFLKPGHVLRCGIEGLDEQCHRVVAFSG